MNLYKKRGQKIRNKDGEKPKKRRTAMKTSGFLSRILYHKWLLRHTLFHALIQNFQEGNKNGTVKET